MQVLMFNSNSLFTCLDAKKVTKKNQERKDIQHFSFFHLDLAVVLWWLQLKNFTEHSDLIFALDIDHLRFYIVPFKQHVRISIREQMLKQQ